MSLSEMQLACNKIIDIYHRYSNRTHGHDSDTLSKQEFKKMIEEQFPKCLEVAKKPQGIENLFKELDKDKNGVIDFKEFLKLLAIFLDCLHELTHDGHGHGHGHSH